MDWICGMKRRGGSRWVWNHVPVLPMMSHCLSTWTWGKPLNLKSENFKTLNNFHFVLRFIREILGLPGSASGKEYAYHCRRRKRYGFEPWVRKIPRSRKWQPAPVFLPGKRYGFEPWVRKIPRSRKWQPAPVFLPGKFLAWQAAVHEATTSRTWLSTREILNIYNSRENK